MKRRKGSLLQRMLAVLLAAVLVVSMVSNAVPVSVLAAGSSITQDGYTWNIPDTMHITVGEETHYGIYGGAVIFIMRIIVLYHRTARWLPLMEEAVITAVLMSQVFLRVLRQSLLPAATK